jgi:hypothetical protein
MTAIRKCLYSFRFHKDNLACELCVAGHCVKCGLCVSSYRRGDDIAIHLCRAVLNALIKQLKRNDRHG